MSVPWTARRSNQSILKEISPGCSLEGLMLKLKLQYFGHLMQKSWFIWKDPDAGKDWRQEEVMTEDEIVGWHHWHNGHGFGWTLGVGDRQGGMACCGSWGLKESDMAEWLNWTELNHHPIPKPDNDSTQKRKLQANIADEHRCKNPQQNSNKQSPTTY